MAEHYEIRPDQRGLAMRIAQRALRVANGLSTARPGYVYIPNKGSDGMGDGTGTWIGSGPLGNGGVAQWIGDTTVPGRPVGITASSSGGVLSPLLSIMSTLKDIIVNTTMQEIIIKIENEYFIMFFIRHLKI